MSCNQQEDSTPPYLCVDCQKEVMNPDTLHQDGRCQDCHNAPAVMGRGIRCTCGIEIERARSLCTEADCFYR